MKRKEKEELCSQGTGILPQASTYAISLLELKASKANVHPFV